MSVRHGREVLSIPGPTTVPDEVLQAMQRPAIDIYSGSLVKLTESLMADMASIFRTKGQTYIYAANGHGGWEAAFSNVPTSRPFAPARRTCKPAIFFPHQSVS